MKKINYKSDFDILLSLRDGKGDPLPFPDCDWDAEFYTVPCGEVDYETMLYARRKAKTYRASCHGGKCVNCFRDDAGVHIVFNDHSLGVGHLRWEPHFRLPNGIYPDGFRDVFGKGNLDIELVYGAGDPPATAEVEASLPYIKGDPFTAEDFTPEQWADLQRPATKAAQSVTALESELETSERARVAEEQRRVEQESARKMAEESRKTAESDRVNAEKERASAEQTRRNAEQTRQDNELLRQNAENERRKAETLRGDAESTRVNAESVREASEKARRDAESTRESNETTRNADESARQRAENTRISNEQTRQNNETERQTAERTRDDNETARRSSETARVNAEKLRDAAEKQRAEEFSGFEDTISGKLDKSVWDDRNEQFNVKTVYIHPSSGKAYNHFSYASSDYLPINSDYPIEVHANVTENASAISLYDSNRNFIGGVGKTNNSNFIGATIDGNDFILPVDKIPGHAVFFRCSSVVVGFNASYSNGPTFEAREGAASEAIAAAKYALFIDEWKNAFLNWTAAQDPGKYDPVNAPDPEHPFYANKLWMTYEQAMTCYRVSMSGFAPSCYAGTYILTNIPVSESNYASGANAEPLGPAMFNGCGSLKVARLRKNQNLDVYIDDFYNFFCGCSQLKEIIGNMVHASTRRIRAINPFMNCIALESFRLKYLDEDFIIKDSPKVNLESFQFLIANARNTTTITVTVHPDVYAKLTGDTTNEAAAALSPEELTEWQQVLTDAAAKDISFATV